MSGMVRTTRLAASARAGLVLALLAAAVGVPATAASAVPRPCEQLAASPAYDADGTVFCAGIQRERSSNAAVALRLFVSTDRARSWRAVAATGVALAADEVLRDLVVSPRFRADRVLVVQLGVAGLFRSTDGGATFAPLYPARAGTYEAFVGVPGGVAAGGAARTLLVGPGPLGTGSAVVLDPVTGAAYPSAGTAPLATRSYLVSPGAPADGGAFAVAVTAAGADERVELYRCTAAFACAERAYAFPKRYRYDRAWLTPDYQRSRTLYVSLLRPDYHAALYWSRDGGRTFRPWTSAQALVDPGYPNGTLPEFGLTGRAGSRTLLFRANTGDRDGRSALPAVRLLRSDDGGGRWRVMSYGRSPAQRGPRGTMPVTGLYGGSLSGGQTPDGFVVAAGRTDVFILVQCGGAPVPYVTRDLGRTWRGACPAR